MEETIVIDRERNLEKDSLLKKIVFGGGEVANGLKLSYIAGLITAGVGRGLGGIGLENAEFATPAVLPLMAFLYGTGLSTSLLGCASWVAYGLGVATVHAEKVYNYFS